MSWLHGIQARVRLLASRRSADERFDEEIGFHIDMEAERLQREEGLPLAESRRRATLAFGGVQNYKEELRDGRGLRWLGGLKLDAKLAVRMMAKWPGLTFVGVVGMAVAVAVGVFAYGIIYTFIGTDVPLDEGDRIVMIDNWDAAGRQQREETHLHDLAEWRRSMTTLSDIGAYRLVNRNLIGRGEGAGRADVTRPEPIQIAEMTASGFRIARVAPLMGRALLDDDERAGARAVVVIGHALWQRRFNGASDVVGRTLQIGVTPHTIVGVMPEGFAFPVNHGIWTPLRLDPLAYPFGKAPPVKVFGRLDDGVSVEEAAAQARTISTRLVPSRPRGYEHTRTGVLRYGLSFAENPGMAWAMHLIQVAVSMLLVVIGINVATLVYARTAGRIGEIAVRTALGASRRRIVAQLFAEAFALSSLATLIGLALALVALHYLGEYSKNQMYGFPYWWSFGLSKGMAAYAFTMALLAAVLVGVIPALKATGKRVRANLQQLGAGGGGLRLGKSWTALIVTQTAIAVTILPLVTYLVFVHGKSGRNIVPDYDTERWLTATVYLDQERDGAVSVSDSAVARRYSATTAEFLRRLRSDAALDGAVLTSTIPGGENDARIEVDSLPRATRANGAALTRVNDVGQLNVLPEFFASFGVPLRSGRLLSTLDVSSSAVAIVVNQPFVEKVFGGGSAIGRRVRRVARGSAATNDSVPPGPWMEIVGVVSDFPGTEKQNDAHPVIYRAMSVGDAALQPASVAPAAGESLAREPLTVAVRVRQGAPESFAPRLREIAVSVSPLLRLEQPRALDDTLGAEAVLDKVIFTGVLLVTLSVLLLSAAGIYALVSFTITNRRREIGIRSALGAGAHQVVMAVLARATRQIGFGVTVGLILATVSIQSIARWSWRPGSIVVLVGVALFMAAVGILSAWGPTREALRIPPTEALRAE